VRGLVFSLVPLLGFYLVDEYLGLFWGVVAAALLGVGEVLWHYLRYRTLDTLALGLTAMVVFSGGLSVLLQSPLAFMFQPVVIEALFAGILLGSVLRGRSLLTVLYESRLGPLPNRAVASALDGTSVRLGMFFLLHAGLTGAAALFLGKGWWALCKGPFFYLLFGLILVLEVVLARRRNRPQAETYDRDPGLEEAYRRLQPGHPRSSRPNSSSR